MVQLRGQNSPAWSVPIVHFSCTVEKDVLKLIFFVCLFLSVLDVKTGCRSSPKICQDSKQTTETSSVNELSLLNPSSEVIK